MIRISHTERRSDLRVFITRFRLPGLQMSRCIGLAAGIMISSQALATEHVNAEAEDINEAIGSLDQSYGYNGLRSGHGSAYVAGSGYRDRREHYSNKPSQGRSENDLLHRLFQMRNQNQD